MNRRFLDSGYMDARLWARIFCGLALTSILIWSFIPSYSIGWDVDVYKNAIVSLRAGHDPYADAIAVERAYQSNPLAYHGAPIPYCYVYSPITLPLLRFVGKLPLALTGAVYWTIYGIAAALMIWAGMQFFKKGEEQAVFGLLAPIAIFFPGMLENDVLFSGNVAIILYSMALCAALAGWKRGRWGWFYAVVLVAGCFKAPMLSLLAIPVFSARRQWLPVAATGAVGLAIFALQPAVWPQLFHNYLQAVDLQFRFNRDFSSSPAGLLANALYNQVPYRITSLGGYLAYAVPVVCVLFYFSQRYFAGKLTLEQWAPLLLVGTILLNPRVMEYDLSPITLPLALLMWRFLGRGRPRWVTIILLSVVFSVLNVIAAQHYVGLESPPWKVAAGCTLMLTFMGGAWNLRLELRDAKQGDGWSDTTRGEQAKVLIAT
jgi:hypothetical protein